ncbi:MAG: hypothetical protein AAGG45_03270 [Pseudomonadota bacterium]
MRTITLTRSRGFYGAARGMGIYVDDEKVGNLMQTKTLEIQLGDGARALYAKMDWAKTDSYDLTSVTDRSALDVKSYFPLNPLKWFGIGGLAAKITPSDVSEIFR